MVEKTDKSGSEWAQQMIQNKNFQEFVPSCSRPISRTPSETTQSELDGLRLSILDGSTSRYRDRNFITHPYLASVIFYSPKMKAV